MQNNQDTTDLPDNADVYVRFGEQFPGNLQSLLERHFKQDFNPDMLAEMGEEGYVSYWQDGQSVIRIETTMWDVDGETMQLTLVDKMDEQEYEDLVSSYEGAEEG